MILFPCLYIYSYRVSFLATLIEKQYTSIATLYNIQALPVLVFNVAFGNEFSSPSFNCVEVSVKFPVLILPILSTFT